MRKRDWKKVRKNKTRFLHVTSLHPIAGAFFDLKNFSKFWHHVTSKVNPEVGGCVRSKIWKGNGERHTESGRTSSLRKLWFWSILGDRFVCIHLFIQSKLAIDLLLIYLHFDVVVLTINITDYDFFIYNLTTFLNPKLQIGEPADRKQL